MATWLYMQKGNLQANRPVPLYILNNKGFHSSSRKWRWTTAFWILLDFLQHCIGRLLFMYSYMHNTIPVSSELQPVLSIPFHFRDAYYSRLQNIAQNSAYKKKFCPELLSCSLVSNNMDNLYLWNVPSYTKIKRLKSTSCIFITHSNIISKLPILLPKIWQEYLTGLVK